MPLPQPPENAAARAADVRQRVQDALGAIWEGHAAATLEETAETADHSLATLSVAVCQINGLVTHSAPIPT